MHPTPVPLKDSLFLSIPEKTIEEISTSDGFKLYLAPEWNFEQNVCITANIATLPRNYNGELKVGDTVAFSYRVVSDRSLPNTSEYFCEITEGSAIKMWMNGRGEKLRKLMHMGVITPIFTGTYFDKFGEFQQGCQGTERQVDKWLQQFRFGKPETFTYNNLISFNDTDYWKCPLSSVFAKKEGDEIIALGQRIICKPIDIPVDERITQINGIKLPEGSITIRCYDRAEVVSGGKKIGIQKGDIVSFEEKYVEKYELFGKLYFLVKEKRINGIWQPNLN